MATYDAKNEEKPRTEAQVMSLIRPKYKQKKFVANHNNIQEKIPTQSAPVIHINTASESDKKFPPAPTFEGSNASTFRSTFRMNVASLPREQIDGIDQSSDPFVDVARRSSVRRASNPSAIHSTKVTHFPRRSSQVMPEFIPQFPITEQEKGDERDKYAVLLMEKNADANVFHQVPRTCVRRTSFSNTNPFQGLIEGDSENRDFGVFRAEKKPSNPFF